MITRLADELTVAPLPTDASTLTMLVKLVTGTEYLKAPQTLELLAAVRTFAMMLLTEGVIVLTCDYRRLEDGCHFVQDGGSGACSTRVVVRSGCHVGVRSQVLCDMVRGSPGASGEMDSIERSVIAKLCYFAFESATGS